MRFEGRPVFWREAGRGTPVILAHCSLAHSGLWKPVMLGLAERRRALSLDLPGHGKTAPPPEGRSLQLYARDMVEAIIDRLGEPAHLVGLSLGGAILGRVAIHAPEKVRSLTMFEPIWFFLLRLLERPEFADDAAVHDRINAAAEQGDHLGAVRHFIEGWGAPGGFAALGPEGQAYAARCFPHVARDFPMANATPPGQLTRDEIASLAPPLMLMTGEATRPSARATVEEIARLLPNARRREIAGAGHMAPVTHWRAVLDEVETFIDAVEAAA